MNKVIGDISMSLDGFVTGPDPDPQHGLGIGGEALHTWAIESDAAVDREILQRSTGESGAVIMGRTLFDFIDGPTGWDDEVGYGATEAGRPPFFVVTSTTPAQVRLDLDFTFVLDGPKAAVSLARDAAGERDVVVMGGAQIVRGCLEAGLLDELRIHLAPVVLGAGTPLFDGGTGRSLVQRDVLVSPHATHLVYEVREA